MATEIRMDFLKLLPDDLLQKILLILPVESLVCLATTCNKWRDYLLDDDFARLHLDRWRSRYGILYTSSCTYYPNLVYSPIFDVSANKIVLARLMKDCFSRRILKEGDYFRVLDSCDGLLLIGCYYHFDPKSWLVVCNPLMKSFKFLQLPPPPTYKSNNDDYNVGLNSYWNIVYDASIKSYKIIGIQVITIMKDGIIISNSRRVYILELCKSSSESEWKEVWVCDDKLGGGGFEEQVMKSVLLVDEKGKKKLYYLTCNDRRYSGDDLQTNLIYIDIETHQVKAVAAAACSFMSLGLRLWVGSSSTGRFYLSDFIHEYKEFNLFVLEDLQIPIWKRLRVNTRDILIHLRVLIQPLEVVQEDGDDEEKILYRVYGKRCYEYQTGRGLWREVPKNTQHYLIDLIHQGSYHANFSVPHLHSLIRIYN